MTGHSDIDEALARLWQAIDDLSVQYAVRTQDEYQYKKLQEARRDLESVEATIRAAMWMKQIR